MVLVPHTPESHAIVRNRPNRNIIFTEKIIVLCIKINK